MISIKHNSNFHITFENGITVSILISFGSYSDNHDGDIGTELDQRRMISSNAELAAWKPDGAFITKDIRPDAGDDVLGWQTPEQILDFLNKASKYQEALGD